MVAEPDIDIIIFEECCSLAKISMVAERAINPNSSFPSCSLAKISMVAELWQSKHKGIRCCSLAKISMVAEPQNI